MRGEQFLWLSMAEHEDDCSLSIRAEAGGSAKNAVDQWDFQTVPRTVQPPAKVLIRECRQHTKSLHCLCIKNLR